MAEPFRESERQHLVEFVGGPKDGYLLWVPTLNDIFVMEAPPVIDAGEPPAKLVEHRYAVAGKTDCVATDFRTKYFARHAGQAN